MRSYHKYTFTCYFLPKYFHTFCFHLIVSLSVIINFNTRKCVTDVSAFNNISLY